MQLRIWLVQETYAKGLSLIPVKCSPSSLKNYVHRVISLQDWFVFSKQTNLHGPTRIWNNNNELILHKQWIKCDALRDLVPFVQF